MVTDILVWPVHIEIKLPDRLPDGEPAEPQRTVHRAPSAQLPDDGRERVVDFPPATGVEVRGIRW